MNALQEQKTTPRAAGAKPVQARSAGTADKLRGLAFDDQVRILAPQGAADSLDGPSFDEQVQMLVPSGAASPKADGAPVQREAAPGAVRPTLKLGSKGSEVFKLQALLNVYGARIQVDGDFGKNTEAAVKAYQQSQGLAVDGIVEENTWAALDGGGGTTSKGGGGTTGKGGDDDTAGDATTTGDATKPAGGEVTNNSGGEGITTQTAEGAGGAGPGPDGNLDAEDGEALDASSSGDDLAPSADVAPDEPASLPADLESVSAIADKGAKSDASSTAALTAALEAKIEAAQAKLDSVQKQIKRLSAQLKKLERKKAKLLVASVFMPLFLAKASRIERDIRKQRKKLVRLISSVPRLTTRLAQQKAELAQKKTKLGRFGGEGANVGDVESPRAAKMAKSHAGPTAGPNAVAEKKVQTLQVKLDDLQGQVKGLSDQIKKLEGEKAKYLALSLFLPPMLSKVSKVEREIKQQRNKLVKLLPEVPRLTVQLAQEKAELARLRRRSASSA